MLRHFFSVLFLFTALLLLSAPGSWAKSDNIVHVLKIDGVISPATYDLIHRQIERAEEQNAAALVLQMHTPGGLYDSTQQIIQDILDSKVPVVTYVSPGGSHAASAGTYILYASHIAAMAPGTNIGAATPVQMSGGGGEHNKDKDKDGAASAPSSMEKKMVNDAAAYIKTLAELRGRNLTWAEEAVREAKTLTASEALSKKVINVIAEDIDDLLKKIDGQSVKMAGGGMEKLTTKEAKTVQFEADWRTKILDIISHPNVAFLLMTLGSYGLIYELANPGAMIPGVIGAICILLALYAMNVMPVNYAGLLLMILGVAFMTGEAFVPSFGVLGIGGAIAFAAGAVMLIDSTTPGFGIDPWLIGVVTLTSVGLLSLVLAIAIKAQRKIATTGHQELLTATPEVLSWSKGKGEVRVTGEVWQAQSAEEFIIKKGDTVQVIAVDGLRLVVAPLNNNEEKKS